MAAFNYMFLPKLYKEYGDGPPTVRKKNSFYFNYSQFI